MNPADPASWDWWSTVYVGYRDHGTVSISNGDEVDVSKMWVAYGADSTGEIQFSDGILTTDSLVAGVSQLTGTGTINTQGIVSDIDLVLQSNADLTQSFTLNSQPSQNITLNLDIADSTYLGAGYTGNGSLTIGNGYSVNSSNGYIGQHAGSTGEVTVTDNAMWNLSVLYLSHHDGNGTLNITNGGEVNVEYVVWGGPNEEIHLDNGTLTTNGITVGASQLTGTGTVNAKGLVSDVNLVFDSADDFIQTITLNSQPGQNVTVNLDASSGCYVSGAGHVGSGSLSISNGMTLSSDFGYIGMETGSLGVTTVDGTDSTWNLGTNLRVGLEGNGTLNIMNGGTVNSSGFGAGSHIGYLTESSGVVNVDGEGSTLMENMSLFIGYIGQGTLRITNGGRVETGGSPQTNFYHNYIGGGPESQLFGVPTGSGNVIVDGEDSTWVNHEDLYVGYSGQGTLNIFNGGLVSVVDILTIDFDGNGDSFINMASGGMLAIFGDGDASLEAFLGLVEGTDAIRYWNDSISDWDLLAASAELGVDYTLEYISEGDLDGYTVLTVTAMPEPATLGLLSLGGLALMRRRSRC
ncbi:MAG: PEP-CTERM sorting domain-containing protein [Phycisphaerae bacterium]|nr:PEP-CTERM sorting domain-containing protein [Phycisphaerae bacterium]